jgi:hypothetical protein
MTQHQKTGKKESLLGTNLFLKKKNRQKVTMIHFFLAIIPFFQKKSCAIFAFFLFVGRVSCVLFLKF